MTDFGQRATPFPTQIIDTLELAVDDSSWTAVILPANAACASKALAAKLRTGNDWKLSERSDGATYTTIGGTLNIDLEVIPGDTAFYAQASSGSDTLEVVITG